jgi:ribonuclease P protein component
MDGYPLRIIFGPGEEAEVPLKMAVSVPKRLFKRATDRNLLKRRIREAYRLQKPEFSGFLKNAGISVRLVVQYRGEGIETYQVIERKLNELLAKLKQKLSGEIT